jgi:FKBP-type peptidyl-prolyl cis-trans isomerase 2
MAEKTKKGEFIEIEFTGNVKDTGIVFDTNMKKDAEKAKLDVKNIKPFILSIGKEMIVKGFDEDLQGKEIGKEYSLEIKPEKAFGKRNPSLVKMVSLRAFKEQDINPQRGMTLSLDGKIARVLSVSGGRVLIDFNNPLAGKDVVYKYKIKRKVRDKKEKINALQDFFFKKRFDFEIKDKKILFKLPEKDSQLKKFIELLSKSFEKILNMKIQIEVEKKK